MDCRRIPSNPNGFFELFLETIIEKWICSDCRKEEMFPNGLQGKFQFSSRFIMNIIDKGFFELGYLPEWDSGDRQIK